MGFKIKKISFFVVSFAVIIVSCWIKIKTRPKKSRRNGCISPEIEPVYYEHGPLDHAYKTNKTISVKDFLEDKENKVQPGDLFLSTNDDFISAIRRAGMNSDFSHAGIFLGKLDGRIVIFHIKAHPDATTINPQSGEYFIKQKDHNLVCNFLDQDIWKKKKLIWAPLRKEIRESYPVLTQDFLVDIYKKYNNVSFNSDGSVTSHIQLAYKKWKAPKFIRGLVSASRNDNKGKLFCSQFVGEVLIEAGIIPPNVITAKLSPEDLLHFKHMQSFDGSYKFPDIYDVENARMIDLSIS